MEKVAVLGVLETERRAVRRQGPAQESAVVEAAEADPFGRAHELRGRRALERDVHGEAVAVGDRGDDDPRSLGQTVTPAVRNAEEERLRVATVERLDEPASRFVPRLVLEPEDAVAVEGRNGIGQPNGIV